MGRNDPRQYTLFDQIFKYLAKCTEAFKFHVFGTFVTIRIIYLCQISLML